MNLIQRNQVNPFSALVEELFDDFLTQPRQVRRGFHPVLELREEDQRYLAQFELPGLTKEDVAISLEDGVLTVKGEKKSEVEEKREGVHYVERQFGSFSRSVRLPKETDVEGISAGMKDGVLTVAIPKATKVERKLISIN
ncbi:MAG: Hsp20/alpha crystallin family protein [bacterium]|jgi:HSP20 family protein